MSCYGCGSSFGAFKKEHGCKNCGFAFCTKCLSNKLPIPKLGNEKHRVCTKCFNIMTGKAKLQENPAKYSPPENYKKRMAVLEEREVERTAGSGARIPRGPKNNAQYAILSMEDRKIQERLDKLKERIPAEGATGQVSVKEIEDRLVKMKGMDPTRYKESNPIYQSPDRRTQQEQMNDLLVEISNEVELDARLPDPAQEIAVRLARLKETEQEENTYSSAEPDENNLNKLSLCDSQTFSQNISTLPKSPAKESQSGNLPKQSEKRTCEHEDVSMEDVGRILNEAAQELEQDAQKALKVLEEDKEIMKKLQEIKQRRKQSSTDVNKDENLDDSGSESDNDNKIADKIIHQAMEENKLDVAAAEDGIHASSHKNMKSKKKINTEEWYDPDELPYCCICTEDATMRCLGCDHDLYCTNCFRDGHQELGLTDHTTIKYIPPKDNT